MKGIEGREEGRMEQKKGRVVEGRKEGREEGG